MQHALPDAFPYSSLLLQQITANGLHDKKEKKEKTKRPHYENEFVGVTANFKAWLTRVS